MSQARAQEEEKDKIVDDTPVVQLPVPQAQTVIEYLEHGERPWFLSTVEIYILVKKTVESLPYSQLLFDKSMAGIARLTKYINDNTTSNLIVLDANQSHELIEKLDSILSENLVILDDGLDGLRAKLSSSLRQLLVAIVNHKQWTESKAKKIKHATVETVYTRYELAMQFVHSLVETVRARFPLVVETAEKSAENLQKARNIAEKYVVDVNDSVKSFVDKTKSNVEHQTFGSLIYLLRVAQPYVHRIVNTSAPLVNKTLSVSMPYLEQAKPHVNKIVSKAVDVTNTLKESKLVGTYVDTALSYAHVAIDETKSYVLPPEQKHQEVQ